MQIPCMGTQQGEDQNENPIPKKPQEEKQQEYRQPKEQPEPLHSGAILQRAEWKLEKNMQQAWSASLLQRRQYHQKPLDGS